MSQEIKIILHDDLDGGEADDTITFVHDGFAYEIDLSNANIETFNKTMQTYVDAARRTGKAKLPTPRKNAASAPAPRAEPAGKSPARPVAGRVPGHTAREIRDWARSQGLDVPEKGRIPQEIADAFKTAVG